MRDLAIAYGNSRYAVNWVNKAISFDDLKERLKVTVRMTEPPFSRREGHA